MDKNKVRVSILASIRNILLRVIDLQRLVRFFVLDSLLLTKKPIHNPKTLLIIRVDGIGDYILFRNFLEALKNSPRFKDYKYTLCGSQAYKELALAYDSKIVPEFIWINSNKMKCHTFYRWKIFREIRTRGFEVVLNPTYSRNPICDDSIVRISGAKEKIGCKGDYVHEKRWEKNIFNRCYTELIDISSSTIFEFNKNKEFIGKVTMTDLYQYTPTLPSLLNKTEIAHYAVICPGSLLIKKRWPMKCFIQVMDFLYTTHGISSVIVGDHRDLPSKEDTYILSQHPYITNHINKLTLAETVEIIQLCKLVVSNDTSVSHIGVATKKPVFVISNGEHYGRFTEYPKEVYDKIYYAYPPTITTSHLNFKELVELYQYGSRLDIKTISVQAVIDIIEKSFNRNDVK